MNDLTQPPTPEEIISHRETMKSVDAILNKPYREYSDEEVVNYITEPMSDCGSTLLGIDRVANTMLSAYKGSRT